MPARFNPDATAEGVVHAARLAGVHELITALPDGYSTQLGEGIGLARALYGDPFLVILDKPNANLDADGDVMLSRTISDVRSRGGIVIVIAHCPSAIASVEQLLVIRDDRQVEFGPKQSVLETMTKHANQN